MQKIKHFSLTLTSALLLCFAICLPTPGYAEQITPKTSTETFTPQAMLRYALAGIMVLLLLVILVLSNAVINAGKLYWEREKKKLSSSVKALLIFIFFSLSGTAHAEEVAISTTAKTAWMPADIGVMLIFLTLEFAVIFVLVRMLQQFLGFKTPEIRARKRIQWKHLFQKVNQTVAVEQEHVLDLDHDYDGIRELDNKIPSWWQYAFYATMVFSAVYLYRMFVSETLPDQFQELQTANRVAAVQKVEYLKNAANNIDENNVVMLDASGIAEGAALYIKNCQACHGDKGQGGVGPNLTDDYWLHNGNIKDIFKSIKYGWQEKGMKSWKDDFSPIQMAQLSSYIKSLHGTNPSPAKEPQGTLYTEAGATDKLQDTITSTHL